MVSDILARAKKFDEAEVLANASFAYWVETKQPHNQAIVLLTQASIARHRGDSYRALDILDNARQIALTTPVARLRDDCMAKIEEMRLEVLSATPAGVEAVLPDYIERLAAIEKSGAVDGAAYALQIADAYAECDPLISLHYYRKALEHFNSGHSDATVISEAVPTFLVEKLADLERKNPLRREQALQMTRDAYSRSPTMGARLGRVEAACLLDMGRLDEAFSVLNRDLAKAPAQEITVMAQLRLLRADCLARKGDPLAAEAYLAETPTELLNQAAWTYGLARLYVDSPALRNGAKAVELARKHIASNRGIKGQAWLLLAQAHELAGQLEEARDAARKASEYSPLLYRKPALALIRKLEGTTP